MVPESKQEAAEFCVVLVTVPDSDGGRALARTLVSERLVACGNVIPGLTSVYRWDGEVQEDPEALLVLKTRGRALAALEERVMEIHPYDTPEFLVLPVTHGSHGYLSWIADEVVSSGQSHE